MNNLVAFSFSGSEIRTFVNDKQEIEFNGLDVAKALGYKNIHEAIKRHCKAYGVVKREVIDSLGRKQKANYITESNLYRLIAHSKMPEAEKFEEWIFDTVLPTIRKTGGYGSNGTDIVLSAVREHAEYVSEVNYPILKGNIATLMQRHHLDRSALLEIIKTDKPGELYKECVFKQIMQTIIGKQFCNDRELGAALLPA